jgi:uncharacterized damage-inducible protein DinB
MKDFIDEFLRYKLAGQKAIAQLSQADLNKIPGAEMNSIAIIVRHISGNLASRFTDFLTSDGEKSWRNREEEFAQMEYDQEQIMQLWESGWQVLESELAKLSDEDLSREVTIRGQALTVHQALLRSLAHVSNHVGQIILLARMQAQENWDWISIPRGKSADYNQNPTMEKRPY